MSPDLVVPSTGGAQIAVVDLGGDGPPALLAHATGFCAAAWRPFAAALVGFHAWALDFRGHGDSVAPAGHSFSWDGFADDVLAVVDALDLDRPVGIGHSKGGASLLLAEERRPGTFERLWVYEPVVFPPDDAALEGPNPLAEGALRRRATFPDRRSAIDNFSSKPPMDAFDPAALEAYVDGGFAVADDGTLTLKCRPEVESQVYRMGSQHHAWDGLPDLAPPVTVARGAVTPFGPAASAHRIAARIPRGRLREFPHLGHFGPLEAPAEMARSAAEPTDDAGR